MSVVMKDVRILDFNKGNDSEFPGFIAKNQSRMIFEKVMRHMGDNNILVSEEDVSNFAKSLK